MTYQATHPVEVGCFGRFGYGGEDVVEKWLALEHLCEEETKFAGIYSGYYVIDWARDRKLITEEEHAEWSKKLKGLTVRRGKIVVE